MRRLILWWREHSSECVREPAGFRALIGVLAIAWPPFAQAQHPTSEPPKRVGLFSFQAQAVPNNFSG